MEWVTEDGTRFGVALDSARRDGVSVPHPFAALMRDYAAGRLVRSDTPPPGLVPVPIGDLQGLTLALDEESAARGPMLRRARPPAASPPPPRTTSERVY